MQILRFNTSNNWRTQLASIFVHTLWEIIHSNHYPQTKATSNQRYEFSKSDAHTPC